MRTYNNKEGINELKFKQTVVYYCPLGNNYSVAKVECELVLGDKIVDFIDLVDYFKELGGKVYTQESLTDEIFRKIEDVYKPIKLTVRVYSEGHIPAEVIKYK